MSFPFAESIRSRSAQIGVVGLGYVGLPVACMLARSGFHVTGVDINQEKVTKIAAGQSPIGGEEPGLADLIAEVIPSGKLSVTTEMARLSAAQVVIICVDTPIEADTKLPLYRGLRGVLKSLGPVLHAGALVIVESTIAPGTMQAVVIPELEQSSGKIAGETFFVGHCPERVTPGLLLKNLITMNRSVGGQTPEIAEAMLALYSTYVTGQLDATDILTAEIVKTAENAYRDVQIAFANELAMVCEQLGADVYAVRDLVNKSPGRAMLMPGGGVGGHCIPKDPWLLIANVSAGYQAKLIPAARAINDSMPRHVCQLTADALARHDKPLRGARVAVLGYAFRENTDDDRETPSQYLVEALEQGGAVVQIHDPHVRRYTQPLMDVIAGADAVVMMVAHHAYQSLDLAALRAQMATPVLVDARHMVNPQSALQAGLTYAAVGRANS
ncbi:MAG: nucleotide sugar dehydrogenase [Anaerolineae bacterium]|nr:nucleotide sugar dehydrogenase [Anaerolineae bacterium]